MYGEKDCNPRAIFFSAGIRDEEFLIAGYRRNGGI